MSQRRKCLGRARTKLPLVVYLLKLSPETYLAWQAIGAYLHSHSESVRVESLQRAVINVLRHFLDFCLRPQHNSSTQGQSLVFDRAWLR